MKKTLLALAMLGSFGAASNAQAYAYAVAYNEVTNLVISDNGNISGSASVSNSSATACLPNGSCVTTGGAGILNAAPALMGGPLVPAYVADSYLTPSTHEGNAASFSLADASIDSVQTTPGTFIRARSMAEGKLVQTNSANANAGNSSVSLLTSTFDVGSSGGQITFTFDAAPYLRAFLSPGTVPVSLAQALVAVNFNIVGDQANNVPASRGTVFNWAPDGVGGGVGGTPITGGLEFADAFSLNTSISALPGAANPPDYNPLTCPIGSVATGCFRATTNVLRRGTYTLNLGMETRDNLLLQAAEIPEPGSLLLLGIGLAALGGVTRRRTAPAAAA